ncbi:MAG TPA: hypothetical protein PLU30_03050 [Verrucomicrobiae bacterium]|nr:hypothetical protein [Verrucomicrobiae bacterium]
MRIGVLIHARDIRFSRRERWLLHFILAAARERGHSVEILQGLGSHPPLDVLIPHVDLTVRPPEYHRFLVRYDRVLNRGVRDISKRALGGRVLSAGEDFNGPVILKADLNFGGRPELQIIPGRRLRSELMLRLRGLPFARRWTEAMFWRWTPCLSSRDYRIYASVREVPPQAFHNPNLVVQPFEPEEQEGLYALRKWTFLGNAETCSRSLSPEPIVKASNRIPGRGEAVPVPEELREFRRQLGMDFGKIDFLVRGGRPIVLDVNPTPSVSTEGGMRGATRRAPLFAEALERWTTHANEAADRRSCH